MASINYLQFKEMILMTLEVVDTTYPRSISCEGAGPNMTTSGVYIQLDYNYIQYDFTLLGVNFGELPILKEDMIKLDQSSHLNLGVSHRTTLI